MIMIPDGTIRPRTSNLPAVRKKPRDNSQNETIDRDSYMPPRNRGFASIPAEEVLQGLIERALAALKQGIFWDRGSILNIQA